MRGKEGKKIRKWLVVSDEEVATTKQNFDQLKELRAVFVEKAGHIPAFSDALAQLNKDYPNFDKLDIKLNTAQKNRKNFEEAINKIGNYTHNLLEIVSDTRDEVMEQEIKDALLPYQQELDVLRNKNKKIERNLRIAKQRLPKAIEERDFWKNEVEQMRLNKTQGDSAWVAVQNKIIVLEQEIDRLQTDLGISQTEIERLNDTIKVLATTKQQIIEEKENVVAENAALIETKEQLTKEKENAYKLAPLITVQANRKRLAYNPKIGLEKLKKRTQKRLEIRFEVPSVQLEAMEKEIFKDYYTASVNVNIYKENGHLALSEQMNLYKGMSGNLYISELALGEAYRAEILQAGKNITQNGSFEFKL